EAERERQKAIRNEAAAEAARQQADRLRQNAVQQKLNAVAKRAEAEQQRKVAQSYSFLAQARALRWSGRIGQRFQSLDALRKAHAIWPSLPPLDLRNEAIACISLVDLA